VRTRTKHAATGNALNSAFSIVEATTGTPERWDGRPDASVRPAASRCQRSRSCWRRAWRAVVELAPREARLATEIRRGVPGLARSLPKSRSTMRAAARPNSSVQFRLVSLHLVERRLRCTVGRDVTRQGRVPRRIRDLTIGPLENLGPGHGCRCFQGEAAWVRNGLRRGAV
jgi:hypothetical protein